MLASLRIAVENQTAMVLGFGGSAKAVVLYLLDNGINNIIIVSQEKRRSLRIFRTIRASP